MDERPYMRLYAELNAGRMDSEVAETNAALIGAPAYCIRAMARSRRHDWASARADFRRALERNARAPRPVGLLDFVAGVGSYIARDYDTALTALERAAACPQPQIRARARKVALGFARSLAWTPRARRLRRDDGAAAAAAETTLTDALALRFGGQPEAAADALDALDDPVRASVEWFDARVRVDLLLGQLEAARARVAILSDDQRARLSAARALFALADGDAKLAVVRTARAKDFGADPRLTFLRGRALAKLGDYAEAGQTLEAARVAAPTSIPVLLALTLARYDAKPDTFDEGLERRFETLVDWAPALLVDAADSIAQPLWTDHGLITERAAMVPILRAAQALLVDDGELITASYRLGELRHLPAVQLRAPPLEGLHANDRPRLAQIESLLVRALGIRPPRPEKADVDESASPAPPRTWTPASLSPEQVERFLADGFLVIEGAFDPELARRWRAQAEARICAEPQRWVRGYDPSDPSGDLRDFAIDDPRTWSWPRIELEGDETLSIAEFSPKGWAAICDLLGGPHRIRTTTWKNYLILNLSGDAHLGPVRPEPSWSSWHIDDPGPMTRLDDIRNGLVCITMVSDLLPASGNTWLAVDSPERVIAELAEHPGGVDYCNDRGTRISKQCQRFHEVVGKAGDLIITHPLMMHSSSPNASGRVRWMGNPMVYLERPFNPFGPEDELSLVEQGMRQVLERSGALASWAASRS